MNDMFAISSSYNVNAVSNAMTCSWSIGQTSGGVGYTMAVRSGGAGDAAGGTARTGFFAEASKFAGKMSFGGSAASGGFEIDMSISNYVNWPRVPGSGVSNFGNFEITSNADTT